MGLSVLPHLDEIIRNRRMAVELYDSLLEDSPLQLVRQSMPEDVVDNYAYYPVVFPSEELLLTTLADLNQNGINARRYFYPSLNKLPYVEYRHMPVAESISPRAACLPLSHEITESDVRRIAGIVLQNVAAKVA
jgi:dTDP-4-amino-4,6-dideoxygalactose transaminase